MEAPPAPPAPQHPPLRSPWLTLPSRRRSGSASRGPPPRRQECSASSSHSRRLLRPAPSLLLRRCHRRRHSTVMGGRARAAHSCTTARRAATFWRARSAGWNGRRCSKKRAALSEYRSRPTSDILYIRQPPTIVLTQFPRSSQSLQAFAVATSSCRRPIWRACLAPRQRPRP